MSEPPWTMSAITYRLNFILLPVVKLLFYLLDHESNNLLLQRLSSKTTLYKWGELFLSYKSNTFIWLAYVLYCKSNTIIWLADLFSLALSAFLLQSFYFKNYFGKIFFSTHCENSKFAELNFYCIVTVIPILWSLSLQCKSGTHRVFDRVATLSGL